MICARKQPDLLIKNLEVIMKRKKSFPEDEGLLKDNNANPMDRALALNRIASDRLFNNEPVIEELINSDFPSLRSEAIMCLLGHWKRTEWFSKAIEMVREVTEPSEVVIASALALNMYHRSTLEYKDEILKAIASRIIDSKNKRLQKRLNNFFLEINSQANGKSDIVMDSIIDWDLLYRYAKG